MKNLEQYKSRFYNLMESTIGEVKPLITEEESWEKFMMDVFKGLERKDWKETGLSSGFIYDTTGQYHQGLPTIQKGTYYNYFRIQYSPKYKNVFWTTNNPNIKITQPNFVSFFVKGENGQDIPKNPKELEKELQKAITDITTKYDFSTLPQTNFEQPAQQSTQPKKQPTQTAQQTAQQTKQKPTQPPQQPTQPPQPAR
jgi:hypothetical protein